MVGSLDTKVDVLMCIIGIILIVLVLLTRVHMLPFIGKFSVIYCDTQNNGIFARSTCTSMLESFQISRHYNAVLKDAM